MKMQLSSGEESGEEKNKEKKVGGSQGDATITLGATSSLNSQE